MAHPWRSFFPISEEARSDCARRRLDSSDSSSGMNVGESGTSENSVGGVEDREFRDSVETSEDEAMGFVDDWTAAWKIKGDSLGRWDKANLGRFRCCI